MKTFRNPILSGFYPDPSVCRAGEDYYLVTSTFAYFPGVPIFHSKDLVHWEQLGHVLTRHSQLKLDGCGHSEGIFAPTIRYNNGTFYMITTNVSGGGNFYVTATDPRGPWSEPVFLHTEGIDPTIFFDNGKAYYLGTRGVTRRKERYFGDNEIYLRELDLEQGKLVGDTYVLWEGFSRDCIWAEGPHLYKKDGYYYLMISEGGTGHEHAITIARSQSLTEGYEGYACNPIITHRHLGQSYPIVNVGHADLVELHDGSWWMVLLASRPYGGYFRNLGRETFLVPVSWENGWPVVNAGYGIVKEIETAPSVPEQSFDAPYACESFESDTLDQRWLFLRNPRKDFYSLSERKGYLRLKLMPETVSERANPSFVAQRQTSINFTLRTAMEFTPRNDNECAGVVLIQNNDFHFRYEHGMADGKPVIRLIKREAGNETLLAQHSFSAERLYLRIWANGQSLAFCYGDTVQADNKLIDEVDARILSADRAGGFVGTCIGLYASSNGTDSANYADFDWVEYIGN